MWCYCLRHSPQASKGDLTPLLRHQSWALSPHDFGVQTPVTQLHGPEFEEPCTGSVGEWTTYSLGTANMAPVTFLPLATGVGSYPHPPWRHAHTLLPCSSVCVCGPACHTRAASSGGPERTHGQGDSALKESHVTASFAAFVPATGSIRWEVWV